VKMKELYLDFPVKLDKNVGPRNHFVVSQNQVGSIDVDVAKRTAKLTHVNGSEVFVVFANAYYVPEPVTKE